jgi:YD repeat-containing protein
MMFLVLTSLRSYSQTTIHYSYDAAGNRTERTIYLSEGKSKGSESFKDDKKEVKEVIEDDTFKPQTVKIYPNPTQGLLEIEVPEDSENNFEIQIIVTDINGRVIVNKSKEPLRTTIDLSNQPGGFYTLTLKKGQISSKWKIIKK